jgi:RNA polymerase sigma factor (sigma-70 family)
MPQPNPTFRSELAAEVPRLRALARRLVAGDDADDVAQDAMVAALSQPEAPSRLRPWLRQVVRNANWARVRSDKRRRSREAALATDAPHVELPVDLAHTEILGAVREVVAELDEPYRVALTERFFEDRTAADIARSEGCPAATVRWRVAEGLRRTRRKLDERFDGADQWRAALAVVAFPAAPPSPAPAAAGATTMTRLTLFKAITATAAIAATATAVVIASSNVGAADDPSAGEVGTKVRADRPFTTADARDAIAGPDARAADPAGLTSALPAAIGDGAHDHQAPAGDGGNPFRGFEAGIQRCAGVDELPSGAAIIVAVTFSPSDAGNQIDELELVSVEGLPQVDVDDLHDCIAGLDPDLASFMGEQHPGNEVPVTLNFKFQGEPESPPPDAELGSPVNVAQTARDLSLPRRGKASAKAKMIVCGDFDCPYCDRARETVDQLLEDYGDDLVVHWMHNPLPFHAGAEPAARAATAAAGQGKFWHMHDALFQDGSPRDRDGLLALATEQGLDADAFAKAFDDPATAAAVRTQAKTCTKNGATGTPSFFIDGELLVGAQPLERFAEIIDAALAR